MRFKTIMFKNQMRTYTFLLLLEWNNSFLVILLNWTPAIFNLGCDLHQSPPPLQVNIARSLISRKSICNLLTLYFHQRVENKTVCHQRSHENYRTNLVKSASWHIKSIKISNKPNEFITVHIMTNKILPRMTV